jgi:hypothetical protein
MDNNDILVRFHELHYQEQLKQSLRREDLLSVQMTIEPQRGLVARAVDTTRRAVCRYDLLRQTALCEDVTV